MGKLVFQFNKFENNLKKAVFDKFICYRKMTDEKEKSKLTQQEWTEYTKQIWDITIPSKNDIAFGIHSAIMPEEIPKRLIKLYSFHNDIILDPFAGSGTTLKVAKELGRNYIGYELMQSYQNVIDKKLNSVESVNVSN